MGSAFTLHRGVMLFLFQPGDISCWDIPCCPCVLDESHTSSEPASFRSASALHVTKPGPSEHISFIAISLTSFFPLLQPEQVHHCYHHESQPNPGDPSTNWYQFGSVHLNHPMRPRLLLKVHQPFLCSPLYQFIHLQTHFSFLFYVPYGLFIIVCLDLPIENATSPGRQSFVLCWCSLLAHCLASLQLMVWVHATSQNFPSDLHWRKAPKQWDLSSNGNPASKHFFPFNINTSFPLAGT